MSAELESNEDLSDLVSESAAGTSERRWLVVAAAALAMLGSLHLLTPTVVLVAVFVLGIGGGIDER